MNIDRRRQGGAAVPGESALRAAGLACATGADHTLKGCVRVERLRRQHVVADPGGAAPGEPGLQGCGQVLADKRMAKPVSAASVIDPQFYLYAERTAPQFFSDLPPIPADRRL